MNYANWQSTHIDGDVNNSNIRQIEMAVTNGINKFADKLNRDFKYSGY